MNSYPIGHVAGCVSFLFCILGVRKAEEERKRERKIES